MVIIGRWNLFLLFFGLLTLTQNALCWIYRSANQQASSDFSYEHQFSVNLQEGELIMNTIQQPVDHFEQNSKTWQQRYYSNLKWFKKGGPIFLLLGGHEEENGDLIVSSESMLTELAQKYNAALYSLEHRFYGKSLPFSDLKTSNLYYLSNEQAIEDVANFVRNVSHKDAARWVIFGGFYGGTLALWFNQKYPNLTAGIVADSAPLGAKLDFYEYTVAIESVLNRQSVECAVELKKAFTNVATLILEDDGRKAISKAFSDECQKDSKFDNLTAATGSAEMMMSFFYQIIKDIGHLLEVAKYKEDLMKFCQTMTNKSETLVKRIARVGPSACYYNQYDKKLNDSDLRANFWQKCTQFGHLESTDTSNDLFGSTVPVSFLIKLCQSIFQNSISIDVITSKITQINEKYGGQSNYKGTNAILIRGDVDPYQSLQYLFGPIDQSVLQYTVPGIGRFGGMYRNVKVIDGNYLDYVHNKINDSISGWLRDGQMATFTYAKNTSLNFTELEDFSQISTTEKSNLVVNGILSIRFALPDPPLPNGMKNYPISFASGIFTKYYRTNSNNITIPIRFWKNAKFYQPGGPFILFLAGMNVASPKWLLNSQLPILNLARLLNATVYLLEHRFYGKSIPESGLTIQNLQFLGVDEALNDISDFITQINLLAPIQNNKWILYGGSYAGALAAWHRQLYPNLTIGAIASSAPLDVINDFYKDILTTELLIKTYNEHCGALLQVAFKDLTARLLSLAGRKQLSAEFGLNLKTTSSIPVELQYFFRKIISIYQYAVTFNNTAGGAIKTVCDGTAKLDTASTLFALNATAIILKYYNIDLNSITSTSYKNLMANYQNESKKSAFASDRCRLYQMCDHLGQFSTTDFGESLFSNHIPINFYFEMCQDVFGSKYSADYIRNQVKKTQNYFGGTAKYTGKNVIFINGDRDPWYQLSNVTNNTMNDVYSLIIKDGSHCSDMYLLQPDKALNSTLQVQAQMEVIISKWLNVSVTNSSATKTAEWYYVGYHTQSILYMLLNSITFILLWTIFGLLIAYCLYKVMQTKNRRVITAAYPLPPQNAFGLYPNDVIKTKPQFWS